MHVISYKMDGTTLWLDMEAAEYWLEVIDHVLTNGPPLHPEDLCIFNFVGTAGMGNRVFRVPQAVATGFRNHLEEQLTIRRQLEELLKR